MCSYDSSKNLLFDGNKWMDNNPGKTILQFPSYSRKIAEITFLYKRLRDYPAIRENFDRPRPPVQGPPPKTTAEVEAALDEAMEFYKITCVYIEEEFNEDVHLKLETDDENRYIFGDDIVD